MENLDVYFLNIIVGLLSLGSVVGGWFLRQLWDIVQTLRKDLNSFELIVARDYVPHNRLNEYFKPVMEALQEIKETLKTKADK